MSRLRIYFASIVPLLASGLAAAADPVAPTPEGRLAGAVRYRTVSHQDREKVSAEAFRGLHAYLTQAFPGVHAGLRRERVNERSLLFTWPGSEPDLAPVLLTAHLDVVPVPAGTEADWELPAFEGVIRDGFVWGRGTLDDKVGVLGQLEAAEALLARGFRPRRTVYLAYGHDEEIGGEAGAGEITKLLESRGVKLAFSLDEGLVIADTAAGFLDRPTAMIGIAEKGYVTLRLVARAPGGHSSVPPPSSAVGKLARAVVRLEEAPLPARLDGPVRELLRAVGEGTGGMRGFALRHPGLFGPLIRRGLASDPAGNAMLRTTTAVTMAGAGEKENLLPREAWAIANFRLIPGDTPEAVVAHVRRVVGDEIEVEVVRADGPSRVSDVDSDGFRLLAEVIREVAPDVAVAPALVTGGTDTKHYGRIAEQSFRFTPLRVGLADRTRVHGVNERIAVENYREVVRFFERLIERL